MNHDHPAIQELYAVKASQSATHHHRVVPFLTMIREHEVASRTKGIRFVDLSKKAPSAYAQRVTNGPLPKNYWRRKPVRESWDPIADEIKAATARKRASKTRRVPVHA